MSRTPENLRDVNGLKNTEENFLSSLPEDLNTPEKRWGHLPKKLHFGEEINIDQLKEKLFPLDIKALESISEACDFIADTFHTKATVIVVGSCANLSHERGPKSDVDVLISFAKKEARELCVSFFEDALKGGKFNIHLMEYKQFRNPSLVSMAASHRLYASKGFLVYYHVLGDLKDLRRSTFDVTFQGSGNDALTAEQELAFMRHFSLSFCLFHVTNEE